MTLESSGFELKNVLENKKPKWKKKKKVLGLNSVLDYIHWNYIKMLKVITFQ